MAGDIVMVIGIDAVIFDLDGTIIDSEPNYLEANRRVLAEHGVLDFTQEMKRKYVGIGTREMMIDIKGKYCIDESVELLTAKKNACYIEIARKNTVVFPEMRKFLEMLKLNRYATAIASGSTPEVIDEILSITKLKGCFDVVVSSEMV